MPETFAHAVWVVGRYKGDQAKSVLAHANAGSGYQIIDNLGTRGNAEVIAAFRYVPGPEGIPDHLVEVVDPYKIQKYEQARLSRSGNEQQKDKAFNKPATPEGILKARKAFQAHKNAKVAKSVKINGVEI